MDTTANMVEFQSNGGTTPGCLAQPTQPGSYPGLVVIQEWWGLVSHIQEVSQRLAAQGFVALAPDLYHGQSASEPDEARKLAMELDIQRAVREIEAAASYLSKLEMVAPKKIGVVGWCMGGSLAIHAAASISVLGAAVAFYGMPRDLGVIEHLHIPLLGLYGEEDHGIPVERVRQLEVALTERGIQHEVHIYPDAGHAFFNDTRPQAYNVRAAEDAWRRTLGWFRAHLR